MTPLEGNKSGLTRKETGVFKIYAVIVAAIGAGLFAVAPKDVRQAVGVIFALLLLPIPPRAVYSLPEESLQGERRS